MILTDIEFSKIILSHYDNPSCVDIKEFQDDVRRFNLLNRYLSNIEEWKPKTIRRIINAVIILYNLFGPATNQLMRYKITKDNLPKIISISFYLNKLTDELGKVQEQDTKFQEILNEFS